MSNHNVSWWRTRVIALSQRLAALPHSARPEVVVKRHKLGEAVAYARERFAAKSQ